MADEPNAEENPNTDGGGPPKRVHNQPYPPNNNRGGRGGGGGGFRGRPQWNRGGGPQNQQNWNNNRNNNNQNRNNSNDGNNQDQEMNEDDGDQGSSSNYPRPFDKDRVLKEKLSQIGGSTVNLPSRNEHEVKFSERNRLYIGNLSAEITETEIKEMLEKYGEICDLQINKSKMFAFVKYDLHKNAQLAKNELEGLSLKNKNLKIRFAPSNATVKVKNLPDFVSNELLRYAFGVFGDVESAQVLVDEKGKPTGEGIVEFTKKGFAMAAVRKCQERCFFITSALQPCIVEYYQYVTDSDGCPEKYLPKKHHGYLRSRETGPRLAPLDSFEHEYGTRWKQMLELYEEKQLALKKELELEKEKLNAQAEFVRAEHETDQLRRELARREMDRERQQRQWEMKEQLVEDMKKRHEEELKRRESAFFQFQPHNNQQQQQQQHSIFSSPPPSLNFTSTQLAQRPPPFLQQSVASIDTRSGERRGGAPAPQPLFGGGASIGNFTGKPGPGFVFNNNNTNSSNARQNEELPPPPAPGPLLTQPGGRWSRQADNDVTPAAQSTPVISANTTQQQQQQQQKQPKNFGRFGNNKMRAPDPEVQIVADKMGDNLNIVPPSTGRFQPQDRRSAEELLQNQQFGRRRGDLVEDNQFASRAGGLSYQQGGEQARDRPPRLSRFEAAPPQDRQDRDLAKTSSEGRRINEEPKLGSRNLLEGEPPAVLTFEPPIQDPTGLGSRSPPRARPRNGQQKEPVSGLFARRRSSSRDRSQVEPPQRAVLAFEPPDPQDQSRRRSRSPMLRLGREEGRELQFTRRVSRSPEPVTWHEAPREDGPRWSPVPVATGDKIESFEPPENGVRARSPGSRDSALWKREAVGGPLKDIDGGNSRKSPEVHPEIIELDDDSDEGAPREEVGTLLAGDPSEFIVSGPGGDRPQNRPGQGEGGNRGGGRNRPRNRRNRMRGRNDSQKRGFNSDGNRSGGPPPQKRRFM